MKLLIFARPKEEFSYEMEGKPKFQWLGEDVCTITYEDRDKKSLKKSVFSISSLNILICS